MTTPNAKAETFTVATLNSDSIDSILLQATDGSYVTVGDDGTLHTGGTLSSAALLVPSLQTNGAIVFGTHNDAGAPFLSVLASGAVAASGSYITDFSTSFDILYEATDEGLQNHLNAYGVSADVTDIDPLLIQVIWDLTGGMFLAIGLGPLIAEGAPRGGIANLLRNYPTVWNAITNLVQAARTNPKVSVFALMAVAGSIYKAGLLWTVLRMALKGALWWSIAAAVTKIIEWVLLVEVEVAELAASIGIWLYKSTIDIDAYINSGAATQAEREQDELVPRLS